MKLALLTTDNREYFKDYQVSAPSFTAGMEALLQGFATQPDVEVHVISCLQQPVKPLEQLSHNIWYHGLFVPKMGWLRTFYQGCIRAVRRTVKGIQPDIVHANGTERDCAISAVFSGYPNVVTIMGNMAELGRLFRARPGTYHWFAAHLENFTLRRTAGVICNSRYTGNLVRGRTQKSWVVYPALRSAFLEPAPPTPRPPVLLVFGIVCPRKRQLELLNVAEALYRQGLKFELRFIGYPGPPDYLAAFRERIKPMEAAGYARYLGAQPADKLVACCDAVAGMVHFPSEEAFGLTVTEGLARNLKFFGARVGGVVEIATGVPGAELFAADDWAGLTAASARWLKEGHPRPQDAAAVMRERYHPEVVARRYLEVYHEVISASSASRFNR